MSQPRVVMAFRKRLLSSGYTCVSIKYRPDKFCYLVSAVEPLAGIPVMCELSLEKMYFMFR